MLSMSYLPSYLPILINKMPEYFKEKQEIPENKDAGVE